MKAYEAGTAAYFATPPVNLIYAYHAALKQITRQSPSLEERFRLHREASQRLKQTAEELGLKQLPLNNSIAANGMTALYFPEGLTAVDLLPRLAKRDIVAAAGLHKDYKRAYCSSQAAGCMLTMNLRSSQVFPHRVRPSCSIVHDISRTQACDADGLWLPGTWVSPQ